MLEDELLKNDPVGIIDQGMTFFFAGSQTLFSTTSNILMYLMSNRQIEKRCKEEADMIYSKYSHENAYDKAQHFEYFTKCYYETLRIEPAIFVSSGLKVTEDTEISGYLFKESTQIMINYF